MIRVLGVMTGTSCDGLDAACVSLSGSLWRVLWSASRNYPPSLRRKILALQQPGSRFTLSEALHADRVLGSWYGSTIHSLLRRLPSSHRPHVIANHGQTVAHHPPSAGRPGVTLQLGDPTRISISTGLTVVCAFREGDQAAGGQGAPLVPLFHALLARSQGLPWPGSAIQNLGGISNVTYLSRAGKLLAFDTGPGNLWIDDAMRRATNGRTSIDFDGKVARAHRLEVDPADIDRILRLPFFAKAPPKSTGRDDFPFQLLLSLSRARGGALVATATEVTARSIADSYSRWVLAKGLPLRRVILCGGGAKNRFLRERISWHLRARTSRLSPAAEVTTSDAVGTPSQHMEAQAFAILGHRALLGLPLGGSWTGARGFGPPAKIVPGENWKEVVRRIASHLKS